MHARACTVRGGHPQALIPHPTLLSPHTYTAPLRGLWARSYSWHGFRAAASSSSSPSSSLLLHAPAGRREERGKQQQSAYVDCIGSGLVGYDRKGRLDLSKSLQSTRSLDAQALAAGQPGEDGLGAYAMLAS